MRNYWLDRVKTRQEIVEARWTPPTQDEDIWIPIRPEYCCPNYDALAEVCKKHWERVEMPCGGGDFTMTDGSSGPWAAEAKQNLEMDENLRLRLEELKLQVISQNPSGLMVEVATNVQPVERYPDDDDRWRLEL